MYAGAQTPSVEYGTLSIEAGTFFAGKPGHDIGASFPYTVTSIYSGTRTQYNFDGTLKGKFTSPAYFGGLNLGYVWKHNNIDAGAGLFREDGGENGVYLKGGYGYGFILGGLVLKPTLDAYFLMSKNKMGTIENSQKEIRLLGYTAYSQYTVKVDDGEGNTYDETYDANHLDVNYRRFILLANPKVILSTRPLGRLIAGLELGWLFQVHQRCDLQLEQTNTSAPATYTVGKVRLDKNGTLGGAYAAINIGVRL